MKAFLAALSVALLMVFSFNVFSQGNAPQQEEKGKKLGCSAMMQDKSQMKECMTMMSKDMEKCMAMMESKEMKEMCSEMMASMKTGSSMCDMHKNGNSGKAAELKSQKL